MGIRALDKQNAEWKAVACTPEGDLKVSQSTLISGEDQANDVLVVEIGQFTLVSGALDGTNDVAIENTAGAAGDYLNYVQMNADANQAVTISDGSLTLVFTATQAAQGEKLLVQAISQNGGWTIKASGASTADFTACGRFS